MKFQQSMRFLSGLFSINVTQFDQIQFSCCEHLSVVIINILFLISIEIRNAFNLTFTVYFTAEKLYQCFLSGPGAKRHK